ncbi:MAG: hypothetical protein AAF891_00255 [Pseudomonadota bacterium]
MAKKLGLLDGTAFLRRRERLQAKHDFPLPMPTQRRPLLWRSEEIDTWVKANGKPEIDKEVQPARINGALLRYAATA